MNSKSPRSEPDSTESTSEAGCEQTRESDQPHVDADASELGSPLDAFVSYVMPTQGEPLDGLPVESTQDEPSDRLPVEPMQGEPSDRILAELRSPTQGERLDGVVAYSTRMIENKDGGFVLEFGEVHDQSENQDAEQEDLPMVPNSFANLDLARVTVWGWILLVGSLFATIIPLMGVLQLLGVDRIPGSLSFPAGMLLLALWGGLFVGGRIFLESRNIPVIRRKKVG